MHKLRWAIPILLATLAGCGSSTVNVSAPARVVSHASKTVTPCEREPNSEECAHERKLDAFLRRIKPSVERREVATLKRLKSEGVEAKAEYEEQRSAMAKGGPVERAAANGATP